MTNQEYDQWLAHRAQNYYGHKWDATDLAPQFIPYFWTNIRIRVAGPSGSRTGTVGVTTGWRPVFLLIHRSSARGSFDVLTTDDRVVAIQRGRRYVPIS